MAPVKLTYFDVTALGEPIRYILHYSGTEFEDERLTSEQFAPRKPTFPLGKLPVLELEGKTVHQSVAISRYLAKKAGLTGKDDWESFLCDIAVDSIGDLRSAFSFHYENNEDSKKQKKELALSTTIPYYLGKFEEILKENGGHFVNGQLTWADFWFVGLVDYLNYMAGKDILADSPGLKALKIKVDELPAIKKYLETRPAVRF